MTDLVSVIVPTHNRGDMLEDAIKSILLQTYENIEIIVVVDGCTDGTEYNLEKYKQDNRFIIIVSQTNIGGGEARNIGIDNASGEYLAFLDDDDYWHENKVSKQVKAFQEHEDVCIVGCNYYSMKDNVKVPESDLPEYITLNDMFYRNIVGSFSFCMLRRKVVGDLRITNNLKASQDWELWINVLLNNCLKIYILKDHLVNYNRSNEHKRLSNSYTSAHHSYVQFVKIFWKFMNVSQRNYHKALMLNQQSYLVEPNSLLTYLKSLKYAMMVLNRFRLKGTMGLLLKFWINRWYKIKGNNKVIT
jgi:glycosyltransferase involved in cell wall biosynthesis